NPLPRQPKAPLMGRPPPAPDAPRGGGPGLKGLDLLAALSAASCANALLALVPKRAHGVVELLAVGALLVGLLADLPSGGELGSELLDGILDLLLGRRVLLLPGAVHELVKLAEHLELLGVGADRLDDLDSLIHSLCRRDAGTNEQGCTGS